MPIFSFLISLSRLQKQLVAVSVDIVLSVLATWLAFSLRLDVYHVPMYNQWVVYALAAFLFIPVFVRFGLYHTIFRYFGIANLRAVVLAVGVFGVFLFAILVLARFPGVPRSVSILQPILFGLFVSLNRIVTAQILTQISSSPNLNPRTVLIYGAGDAGVQAANSLAMSGQFLVAGFIDDDAGKHHGKINGIGVYSAAELSALIDKWSITDVLLALPNASIGRRRAIVASLADARVRVRSLPEVSRVAAGEASLTDIEELDIADLLERPPVATPSDLDLGLLGTVMVTGAGGSIGSELCRQLIQMKPECLILLDHNEFGLYTIHREISEHIDREGLPTRAVAHLASVRDITRLDEIVSRYQPQAIYHAAAYKHVPLVEDNPLEGITNNVEGTWNIAVTAHRHGVERFVLISTDKAVRPTNTMGASKRMAEMVIQAIAQKMSQSAQRTVFSIVRFGNVLGSSGSVVPLFSRQIRHGGPVTITDPEVTRYFMTVSEAVSLVLQAGSMAEGGEVFVLDMGEPVRILDLARKMIRLSGMTEKTASYPAGDIEIKTIGLRPGEKLYEELIIGENPVKTGNPLIFMARETHMTWLSFEPLLEELRQSARCNDVEKCKKILRKCVAGYMGVQPESSKTRCTAVVEP